MPPEFVSTLRTRSNRFSLPHASPSSVEGMVYNATLSSSIRPGPQIRQTDEPDFSAPARSRARGDREKAKSRPVVRALLRSATILKHYRYFLEPRQARNSNAVISQDTAFSCIIAKNSPKNVFIFLYRYYCKLQNGDRMTLSSARFKIPSHYKLIFHPRPSIVIFLNIHTLSALPVRRDSSVPVTAPPCFCCPLSPPLPGRLTVFP